MTRKLSVRTFTETRRIEMPQKISPARLRSATFKYIRRCQTNTLYRWGIQIPRITSANVRRGFDALYAQHV